MRPRLMERLSVFVQTLRRFAACAIESSTGVGLDGLGCFFVGMSTLSHKSAEALKVSMTTRGVEKWGGVAFSSGITWATRG